MTTLVAAASVYSNISEQPPAWWRKFVLSLARLRRAFAATRRRRRIVRALLMFDRYTLADIGLGADEIEDAVRRRLA